MIVGTHTIGALPATAPGLGMAVSFAVLAGSTVTSTGNTVITGDLGVSPGTACTGLPAPCTGGGPGTVSGAIQAGDAEALQAQTDLTAAYNAAASSTCDFDKTGQDLGTQTLTPGTYSFSSSEFLTGTLTLSGDGVFIFQAGSTLITAPGSTVLLINGAQACNVFWQVGSSATLDTTTTFVGTLMALASITMNDSASIDGRALPRTAAVTMINNRITVPTCLTGTHADTDSNADANAHTNADAHTHTDANPHADANSHTSADADTDTLADADSHAHANADTRARGDSHTHATPSLAAAPTATPTPTPALAGVPNGGGGPPQGEGPPQDGGFTWVPALVAGILASAGSAGVGLTVQGHRRST